MKSIRCIDMNLSNTNIDAAVENIRNFFQKAGVSHKDELKICLVVEEALLRYQDEFGEAQDFELYMKKWFSAPKVIIRLKGKPFNTLEDTQADSIFSSEVMRNLLQYDAAGTTYRYENGCNELVSFSTRERKPLKIPGGKITVAIVLAIICSLLAGFLEPSTHDILINDVVAPILSTLMQLIVTVTVFMMFFSIVSSICAIEDTAMLSNIGTTVLGRFFLLACVIIFIAICVSLIFFPVFSLEGGSSIAVADIIKLFLSIVPTNILAAFSESKVLQVAVMAFLVGICITAIGNRITNIKTIVNEFNILIFKVMAVVFSIIPFAVFLCIFKTLSTNDLADFLIVWRLVAAELIAYALFLAIMMLYMRFTTRTNLRGFMKKISPAVVIAFTTSSSIAAFPKNLELAEKNLCVEEKFCTFWLPIALVLFAPSLLIEVVGSAFYAMSIAGQTISIMQLLIIAFLAVQLSIATPKVAGGAAASFGILLTQLGLPTDLLGLLMIANVLGDNFFSSMNVIAHDCELMSVAHKLGFVDSEVDG